MIHPPKVVCVLWGQERFFDEYVYVLERACLRNCATEFVCLSDRPLECNWLPLPETDLQGFWNKMLLFHPKSGLRGQWLFLDLDMVIQGSLHPFTETPGRFVMLRSFDRGGLPDRVSSCVMRFDAEASTYIWDEWDLAGRPQILPGDQDVIGEITTGKRALFPEKLVWSYKAGWHDGVGTGEPPKHVPIVAFHGHPMPHEVDDEWVRRNWA